MSSPANRQARPWIEAAILAHRVIGLIALPFLIVSILIAVSLTHPKALRALSESVYPSLPIPQVALDEPVRAGSWDQALLLARLAAGAEAHVITLLDDDTVAVTAFATHNHDAQVAGSNPHTQYTIDLDTMRIVRADDRTTSLFRQAHAVHALRFFGIEWASVAFVTTVLLLVLLLSGGLMVWRDRREGRVYAPLSRRHVRMGQLTGLMMVLVAVTTLDMEFGVFARNRLASHPIPVVQLGEPVHPGSLDQARRVAALATGAAPRAVFIQGADSLKFSQEGDGIGGKSVWVDGETMTIKRISDWRNDAQALSFIIHDGRWLGGMNAFNVNDAAALGFLFLTLSGVLIFLTRRA